jgi:hypothetical protein
MGGFEGNERQKRGGNNGGDADGIPGLLPAWRDLRAEAPDYVALTG